MSERKIIRISSHLVERYETCPRYFNFTTNENWGPKKEIESFSLGKLIHHMLAYYYNQLKLDVSPIDSLDTVIKVTESKLAQDSGLEFEDIATAIRTVREYVSFYLDDPLIVKPVTIEELLSRVIYEDDEIVILYEGTPDLTFANRVGEILPLDHKSESARRPVHGLSNQLLGYCFLTDSTSIYRNAVGLQTTVPPPDKFYRQMISFPRQTIDEWKQNVVRIGKKIISSYKRNVWEGHYSMCESNPIWRSGCIFREVCNQPKSEWQWELEDKFQKVEGVYY